MEEPTVRQHNENDRPIQLIPTETRLASLTLDMRWLHFDHLYCQGCWSWLWNIQKLLPLKSIKSPCRNTSVEWITFEVVFSGLADIRQRSPQILDGMILWDMEQSCPVQLNHQRLDWVDRMYTSWPILDPLFMNNRAHCYDIRNRIFGLLILSPPCSRQKSGWNIRCPRLTLVGKSSTITSCIMRIMFPVKIV